MDIMARLRCGDFAGRRLSMNAVRARLRILLSLGALFAPTCEPEWLFGPEEEAARFEVVGQDAFMTGVIGESTPERVDELLAEHPEVTRIVMLDVPGSMDDEANMVAVQKVHDAGLATHVPADGMVASGGTDFFLAGAQRTIEFGALLGVHSWSDGFGREGSEYAEDAEDHRLYLDFYEQVGVPDEFYWYTLDIASADDIHWMNSMEIAEYDLLSDPAGLVLEIETAGAPNEIVPLPAYAPAAIREQFERYTRLLAPNGKPIHFFAQDEVSDAQLIRAREVMRFYLTDAKSTRYGGDKSAVANAMADRSAALVYFNTEADAQRGFSGGLGELPLFFQDLYAEESVVEGSPAYLDNSVRDATLEEVFHLVQGAGIQPAMPWYQYRIEFAAERAVERETWFTNPEWEAEGSSSFEYIISVIDVAYGLWAHDPDGNGESFHGEYRYCRPEELATGDAVGLAVVRAFLPEDFGFHARIDPNFEGEFSLQYDASLPYTLKSRFLSHVELTGDKATDLRGGDRRETLHGNAGDNQIFGGAGDDVIEGGDGSDTAIYTGKLSEYEFTRVSDRVTLIRDSVADRDGLDFVGSVEWLQFADQRFSVASVASMDLSPSMRSLVGVHWPRHATSMVRLRWLADVSRIPAHLLSYCMDSGLLGSAFLSLCQRACEPSTGLPNRWLGLCRRPMGADILGNLGANRGICHPSVPARPLPTAVSLRR